jgi:hypothetical protein
MIRSCEYSNITTFEPAGDIANTSFIATAANSAGHQ